MIGAIKRWWRGDDDIDRLILRGELRDRIDALPRDPVKMLVIDGPAIPELINCPHGYAYGCPECKRYRRLGHVRGENVIEESDDPTGPWTPISRPE